MLISKLTAPIGVVKLRIIHCHVVAASILNVNVNLLMVKLLTMNQYGYEFDLPFFKAKLMGTVRGSAT